MAGHTKGNSPPKVTTKKHVPEKKKDVVEFDAATYETIAKNVREKHGVLPFSVGGVSINPDQYVEVAGKLGKEVKIYQAKAELLEGFDGQAATKGKEARIFLNRSLKNSAAGLLALVVHELTHVICEGYFPSQPKQYKEAACYIAQMLCSNKNGVWMDLEPVKGFNEDNTKKALFKAANAIAEALFKNGKKTDTSALTDFLTKNKQFIHM